MDRHQRQSAIEEWLVNGEIILKEHEKLKRVIEDPQQSAHVAFFKLYYHIDKIRPTYVSDIHELNIPFCQTNIPLVPNTSCVHP